MIRRSAAFLSLLLTFSGCQAPPPPVVKLEPVVRRLESGWRAIARAEDAEHIDRLPLAWEEALAQARARGRSAIRAEGALLDPGAALPRAAPPPGPYRCRLLRFGGRRAFTAYPWYFCDVVVEGALLSLTKQAGGERPGGYLWSEGDERLVFVGAVALGDEPMPGYGDDPERDLVGVVERVAPFHYRLVMPRPPSGATLDVLELVPFVLDEG